MDPALFRAEHAKLARDLADAKTLEERLAAEVAAADALAACGQDRPPGYAEAQWLLTRARESVQKVRNQIDRVVQRRNEAVAAAILTGLRAKWPQEVARIERDALALFDLGGAA
jgi:phage terminase Nu1 subunit (DNA packaging protein)